MKTVGKSVPKTDALPLALGKPVYTEDLTPVDALVVKILHSPHAFARIRKIDAAKALKLDGVACVITHHDVPKNRFTLAGQSYPEPSPYDRLLLDETVRYVGDAVAIVGAKDEATALKALKLIKVEYEIFEAVLDFEKAIGAASVIHAEEDLHCNFPIGMQREKNIAAAYKLEAGDVEGVFAACSVIVEETYYTQAQAHAMMETYRAFSSLDHNGRLVVVSSTQIPFHVRRQLARALDVKASRIRVVKPRIGGGFGGKQTGVVEMFCAIVTLKTGKAAQIVYDRKETFTATTSRHAMRLKVRLGADDEGSIKAIDIEALSDTGAYGEHAFTVFAAAADKTLPLYNKAEAVRFKGEVVYTNKLPAGALRGYGATQGTFALESAVNKLAAALKTDPLELRLKNLILEGETSLTGKKITSSSLQRCLKTGSELFDWQKRYAKKQNNAGKVRGVGMAVTMQGSGIAGIDTATVQIRWNDDGNYTLLIGSTDMGNGSDTILAQMAAEVLETEMENIIVHAADTDVSPYDPGSYASSTTYVTGMAVVKAAQDLKRQILEQAALQLAEDEKELYLDGGRVCSISGKEISFVQLAAILATGRGCLQLSASATHGSPVSPPPFVAGFAEVEVDVETGKVDLLRYLSVVDCGTLINPNLARVQVEGGTVQGIGMALIEDVRHDRRGMLETNSFMQYKIPCRKDIGKIETVFEPSYEPTGPFGAKSVGEVVINTPPPAIAHAIYDATGVWLTHLPFLPEKVYMALRCEEKNVQNKEKA